MSPRNKRYKKEISEGGWGGVVSVENKYGLMWDVTPGRNSKMCQGGPTPYLKGLCRPPKSISRAREKKGKKPSDLKARGA